MAAVLERKPTQRSGSNRKIDRKTTTKKAASNVINLRVDDDTHALIERARSHVGLNRTEFMLTSVRTRAQEVLLEQTYISLSHDDWDAFQACLDSPPAPNHELKRLMAKKAPWED